MLISFLADGSNGIEGGALWALVGAAITAVGAVTIKILMARHQISQDERKDLRDEWRELSQRQQDQIDGLKVRIVELEKDKDECQKQNTDLRIRVASLEYQVGPVGGKT